MDNDAHYVDSFNREILIFFKNAARITFREPAKALFFLRTLWWQKRAADKRHRWQGEGLHVPPFLILSLTTKCNLHCAGCVSFSQQKHRAAASELADDRLRSLISEAHQLGVSAVILAGGEPLMRKEVLSITRDFPSMVFPLITNGTLINDAVLRQFGKQRNVIPILSIEGDGSATDARRGTGIYKRLQIAMEKMRAAHVFFGCSLTLTSANAETIANPHFIKDLVDAGARLFLLLEYVPFDERTTSWILTEEQRVHLRQQIEVFRSQFPALFIAIPGDEEQYGGCLAAGRGFVHISAGGDVEPCPASPFSDASIATQPLKEALRSDLLQAIRQQDGALTETAGGCALWTQREWVRSLLPVNQRIAMRVAATAKQMPEQL